MGVSLSQILVIAVIIVLLFGAKRIPAMLRGMGEGIREFKKSIGQDQERNQNQDDKGK